MTENTTPEYTRDIALEEKYNQVPYISSSFSFTHPNNLFTLATLFGLKPTPVERARVLEIGCASGGNLIPMAYHSPTTEFLGVDLAEKQIDMGIDQILDLNLKNIFLRHQSIIDFGENEGKFDYIICHGVFSWVDDAVRNKILQVCRDNLTPNGIAYISYNTFPGWHMVNSIRDLMCWHTQNFNDPTTKAQHARSVLQFLTNGLKEDNSPYANFVKGELALLSKQSDSYLFHDHLELHNHPMYFYQFMELANKHQLAYLSDVFLSNMFSGNLPPVFATQLQKITNIIASNQYIDFIRNQRFRCTLLCHQDQVVNRSLKTTDVEKFYLQFSGQMLPEDFTEADIGQGKEVRFTNNTITLTTRDAASQQTMLTLFNAREKPIHYDELCKKLLAQQTTKNLQAIKQHLNEELNLMRMVLGGLIQLSSYEENHLASVEKKPLACPLIRYLSQKQMFVTNRRHQPIPLDPLSKILLPYLDGKHDLEAFIQITHTAIKEGKLNVLNKDKQPIQDDVLLQNEIKTACENMLNNMAKQAILIPNETRH